MRIKEVLPESLAARAGVQADDYLMEINGNPIRDIIDYRFYNSESSVLLKVKRAEQVIDFRIRKQTDQELGLDFEPFKLKACGCNCIFCFAHQNPDDLRSPLYFKDEDYRLSFMNGSYFTLNTTGQEVLDRIVAQRLSPLYISVHATDAELRKKLFGIQFDDGLFTKIDFLTRNGIQLHTQVVVCPEINDGDQLERTFNDLAAYFPHIPSVAIVPVGLTEFREGLFPLKPVTVPYAQNFLKWIRLKQAYFRKKFSCGFVYPSDEWFIKAGRKIPGNRYYDDFPQVENGVGLVRTFLNLVKEELPLLPQKLKKKTELTFVTGLSAGELIREVAQNLMLRTKNLKIRVKIAENKLFGESITIAPLLSAGSILSAVQQDKISDPIILPPRIVNEDMKFLDDMSLSELQERLQRPVYVFKNSFIKLFEDIYG